MAKKAVKKHKPEEEAPELLEENSSAEIAVEEPETAPEAAVPQGKEPPQMRKTCLMVGGGALTLVGFAVALVLSLSMVVDTLIGGEMLVGFIHQDGLYNFNRVPFRDPTDVGDPLIEEVQLPTHLLAIMQDAALEKTLSAGYLPDGKTIYIPYQDLQNTVLGLFQQKTDPLTIFESQESTQTLYISESSSFFISEETPDGERCYLAPLGQPAVRVAREDACSLFTLDTDRRLLLREDKTFSLLDRKTNEIIDLVYFKGEMRSFLQLDNGQAMLYWETPEGENNGELLYFLDFKTGTMQVLNETKGTFIPVISNKDGSHFAYVSVDKDGHKSLYLDQGTDHLVKEADITMTFTADGRWLVFTTTDNQEDYTLSVVDPETRVETRVGTYEKGKFSALAKSDDIIIRETRGEAVTLYWLTSGSTTPVAFFKEEGIESISVLEVPELKSLLVMTTRDSARSLIYYPEPNEESALPLLEGWDHLSLDTVSPNGRWLVVDGRPTAEDETAVYLIDLEDPEVEPVMVEKGAVAGSLAFFSKDGNRLIFSTLDENGEMNAYLYNIRKGGRVQPLYHEDAMVLDVNWEAYFRPVNLDFK